MSCRLFVRLFIRLFIWAALLPGSLPGSPLPTSGDPPPRYLGRTIARTMHWTGADWLLRETREDEENAVRLREWLALKPGDTVCDLGCGNGFHTLPLAREVGPKGRVYAVDIQPQMLVLLRERLGEEGIGNVTLIEAGEETTHLPERSCDLVLMVDVYHELVRPQAVLAEVRQALRPGGRLVLVEFRAEDPDVPIRPLHKMSRAQIVRELAANGFAWSRGFDGLPRQHAMEFTPAPEWDGRSEEREFAQAFWRAAADGECTWVAAFLAPRVDDGHGEPRLASDLLEELADEIDDGGLARWREARSNWSLSFGAATLLARRDARRERIEFERDDDGALWITTWRRGRPPAPHLGPLCAPQGALGGGPLRERLDLAAQLGYGGVQWGAEAVGEVRALCEKRGMDLWSVAYVLDIDSDPDPRAAELNEALAALEGGVGQLWLVLQSSSRVSGDPAGDPSALRTLKRVLAEAGAHRVPVALYPRFGSWLGSIEDARRLLGQVQTPELGVCFDLCGWLQGQGDRDPAPLLRLLAPRLMAVTLGDARRGPADWSELRLPLGDGQYDLAAFLTLLEEIDFDGPVALAVLGAESSPRESLARSMAAWKELRDR